MLQRKERRKSMYWFRNLLFWRKREHERLSSFSTCGVACDEAYEGQNLLARIIVDGHRHSFSACKENPHPASKGKKGKHPLPPVPSPLLRSPLAQKIAILAEGLVDFQGKIDNNTSKCRRLQLFPIPFSNVVCIGRNDLAAFLQMALDNVDKLSPEATSILCKVEGEVLSWNQDRGYRNVNEGKLQITFSSVSDYEPEQN